MAVMQSMVPIRLILLPLTSKFGKTKLIVEIERKKGQSAKRGTGVAAGKAFTSRVTYCEL